MEKKKCTKCNLIKPLSEFYKAKDHRDGHTTQCMICLTEIRNSKKQYMLEYSKNYREKNAELVRDKNRQAYRQRTPKKRMLMQAKNRAKNLNIDFNITEDDIIIPEVCPYLNVPFVVGTKYDYQYTYSLDRIDNKKGYIKGNVQVITMKANMMKNSATLEELITFSRNILNNNDIVRTHK